MSGYGHFTADYCRIFRLSEIIRYYRLSVFSCAPAFYRMKSRVSLVPGRILGGAWSTELPPPDVETPQQMQPSHVSQKCQLGFLLRLKAA